MALQNTDHLLVQRDGSSYKMVASDLITYLDDSGFGSSVTISETTPVAAESGDMWWNSSDGNLYIYYEDSDTAQWVVSQTETGGAGVSGPADIEYTYTSGQQQTLQARLEQYVSVKDFGAVGDGVTDDTAAIQAAVDAVGSTTFTIPSGDYLISGTLTLPASSSVELVGRLMIDGTGSVTIYGSIDVVGDGQHFNFLLPTDYTTSPLKIRHNGSDTECNPNVRDINPFWFNGTGVGDRTNKALRACGSRTKIKFPPGNLYFNSTNTDSIILLEATVGSQITLEGHGGHLATTLVMNSGIPMIGVNGFGADEPAIRELRVIEDSGTKVSCCFNIGGTSAVVDNCWAGNAKYGFMLRQTAGAQIRNIWSEYCYYGMVVCSNFGDYSIPGLDTSGGSVVNTIITSGLLYESGQNDNSDDGGLLIGRARSVQVGAPVGTFSDGQTVTFSNGTTAKILSTGSPAGTNQVWFTYLDYSRNGGTPTTSNTLSTTTGSGNVANISQNQCSAVVASNLDVRKASNYGAVLFGADGLSINNCMFNSNGSATANNGYGVEIVNQVVQFTGCLFDGNVNDGGIDDRAVNVAGGGVATFSGCTFKDQTIGLRASAGGVLATTGCIFSNCGTTVLGSVGTDINSITI